MEDDLTVNIDYGLTNSSTTAISIGGYSTLTNGTITTSGTTTTWVSGAYDSYVLNRMGEFELDADAIETPEDMLRVFKFLLQHNYLNLRFSENQIKGIEDFVQVKVSNIPHYNNSQLAKLRIKGVNVIG